MQKIFLFLIASLFTLASYAATPHPDKLSVVLDWFPNPDHAPLIIALDKGFFKEQGLEVSLLSPSDPTDPPKWVAARKADIGITYEPQYMVQIDKGLPLLSVGTLIDKPLNCLVTLEESGIKSLDQLKNKKVGTATSGITGALLSSLLKQHDLSQKDIELINVKYNLTQALLSHRVDAVTGMNRNLEVPLLESAGHKMNVFFPEDNGIPNYSELIFITHEKSIHDKRIPKFLAALKKAIAYLDNHPQDAWELFIKRYPASNNHASHEAWFATIPYFAEDPAHISGREWTAFSQFMFENKMIKKIQPFSRYAAVLPRIPAATPI